jgi:hypothetical protein
MATEQYREDKPIRGIPFFGDWLKALYKRQLAQYEPATDRATGKTIIDTVTGFPKMMLKPLGKEQEQPIVMGEDGQTRVICIGCGEPFFRETYNGHRSKMFADVKETDRITIGGIIQMPHVEVYSEGSTLVKHRRWRVQPVMKSGLGCDACKAKFQKEVDLLAPLNDARACLASLMALARAEKAAETTNATLEPEGRCKHGIPDARFCSVCLRLARKTAPSLPTMKLPEPRKAFLAVIEKADQ